MIKKKMMMIAIFLLPFFASANDTEKLKKVVEDFGEAIETKDKEKFLQLFIQEGVSWVGVSSKAEYKKFAEVTKNQDKNEDELPSKIFQSTPEKFIDWVVTKKETLREEFKNIKITTDGEIAAVYFDYEFYFDKERQNWGSESWLLVNTESGWKIQAVNFSVTRD